MLRKVTLLIAPLLVLSLTLYITLARSAKETAPKGAAECYQCHEQIKSLKIGNKHSPLPLRLPAGRQGRGTA